MTGNFNPRAPCGARPLCRDEKAAGDRRFQSTRPVRGATYIKRVYRWCDKFQSTRPVRGAPVLLAAEYVRKTISIHAPRAGRDRFGRSRYWG